MKTHDDAQKLLDWLAGQEREGQPPARATVRQIAASGVITSRAASDAVQYALRHGSLRPVKRPGAAPNERVAYELTGTRLPAVKKAAVPDFGGLLSAFGIAHTPVAIASVCSHRFELAD